MKWQDKEIHFQLQNKHNKFNVRNQTYGKVICIDFPVVYVQWNYGSSWFIPSIFGYSYIPVTTFLNIVLKHGKYALSVASSIKAIDRIRSLRSCL